MIVRRIPELALSLVAASMATAIPVSVEGIERKFQSTDRGNAQIAVSQETTEFDVVLSRSALARSKGLGKAVWFPSDTPPASGSSSDSQRRQSASFSQGRDASPSRPL